MKHTQEIVQPTALTGGGKHHFFGYYDKSCWDASSRWIVGMETDFMDRPPRADDVATIGLIDLHEGNAWKPIAETRAWNWQQGCMLQWLGDASSIIFNDRVDGQWVARILDVQSGAERAIDRPIYGLNAQGTHAVSLNFARLQHQRPGYGYPGVKDPTKGVGEPEDDGIYSIDIASGESKLIFSLAQAAALGRTPDFSNTMHRFNHLQFNRAGDRVALLHRYKGFQALSEEVGITRLLTMGIDGSDVRLISDHRHFSHYDWKGSDEILAWASHHGTGLGYYLYDDIEGGEVMPIGTDVFDCDGHCSFSPDQEWVLTDTYPDEQDMRTLLLYHWASGERIDIGRFHSPPMDWQIRCDLHPRWSRDGRHICIDSIHEGSRQMYLLDVSEIVSSTSTLHQAASLANC
ncbi:hypothetical protein SH580_04330 [Coraliomargarita algicola]|uniref:Uncharacterized protein n=1 Tax=Coraliomargarita algicola TaxID=3092156 RepID=A0ABZ0RNE1_9BACT|nr:hypothetical protein [Coraliomargarita sp. J2-16]WPJ96933.1 hypothetical protein SH580_04330 [Coraliomargarita sp. J2-16]